ncbi:hypothetical protein F6X37_13550 [Paraburkholderia sp. 31.1]|uniref:hypothetical protein n=1 Tax=Paraburkholderia sp. 31.1 TaxID=2615205 RepID=UPI001655F319|nr:hypothetical protein [Paraburkholderia sp. 31.1]MBC8722586.1 hypothetical protein [Paraburkholderia sp. 31.1]
MRPLTEAEIEMVSGAETITYTLPAGSSVTTTLLGDSSTSITVNIPGVPSYTWNSGIAVTCFILGTGFGMTAGILSGKPTVGALTDFLVSKSCSAVMKDIQQQTPTNDGDG